MNKSKTVLILGGNGMLGQTLFFHLVKNKNFKVFSTIRDKKNIKKINSIEIQNDFISDIDLSDQKLIENKLLEIKPDIIINCAGILTVDNNNILSAIRINSELPNRLSFLSKKYNFRLIHISTDCVFDGLKGDYSENDQVDISSKYGMTKYLGEVIGEKILTIRTSIIGHNYCTKKGLLDWFLNSNESIEGFSKYIYSGIPTVELSRIITKYILPNKKINGIYHIASKALSKFELLKLISESYNKKIKIIPISEPKIDRSLNFSKFSNKTGFSPMPWREMINNMQKDYEENLKLFF